MDATLKAKWVAALRSGEYEQTQGCLRKHGGYCCLGVLCEVAGVKRTPAGYEFETGDEGLCILYGRLDTALTGAIDKLVEMNDEPEGPRPFAEIADWIETNITTEAS